MGKSQKAKVAEYRMSTHFGICHGPVRLRSLVFGDKVAWTGDTSELSAIGINNLDLFGGVTKEGGVKGTVYYLPGTDDQLLPEVLAERLELTSATAPGFRGIASVFMVSDGEVIPPTVTRFGIVGLIQAGQAAASLPGFVWGYNSPYLKTFAAGVSGDAFVTGLSDDFAMIDDQANAVHIIYDCLTNEDWGMGAPTTALNTVVWQAAAQTIFNEGLGLSLGWFAQSTIEDFVGEILDHIQATVFVNPANGLFEIKLLRDDYDRDTLPLFDEQNSVLNDFQRKGWGETINEIVVEWTNPENEDTATVSQQELGNIIAQGGVVSETRSYKGVRSANLAAQLAVRDVRSAAAPLASCTLICNRDGANLVPGGVIKVSNTKLGLSEVIFRIGDIDYGKSNEAKIRLSLLEDIFGFRVGAYFTPPDTLHVSGVDPEPATYSKVMGMPAFLYAQYEGEFPVDPDTFIGVLGTSNRGSDTSRYELLGQTTSIGGTVEFTSLGTRSLNARSALVDALVQEAQSLIEFGDLTLGVGPQLEGFVLIGGADEDQEICFLSSIDSNNVWTMERGMLDTTPKAWPAGTEIWFLAADVPFDDETARVEGEVVKYKILPQTSKGTLSADDAPELTFTATNRPNLPTRPARVQLNGMGFGEINLIAVAEADGDITLTWANRNRDTEETRVLFWNDIGVTPPVGQTTTVRLYRSNGTLIREHAGLTGETYLLDPYDYAGKNLIRVHVTSSLAGEESLQGYDLYARVGFGGWGLNWGYSWGGGA